jgi:hypothetical protein
MAATKQPSKIQLGTPYAILAALIILAIIFTMIENAHRVSPNIKEATYAEQISVACETFRMEYGALPETTENYRLKKILCGDNLRKIEFISLKLRDVNVNGEMIDPWGTPFRIMFDDDFKVHVISAGPDKIFGTPDDITN